MVRTTHASIQNRVAIIARNLCAHGAIPTPDALRLSKCQPGDGCRWQIEIHNADRNIDYTLPRYGHYKTRAFDAYLDGIIDVLERIPLYPNRKATR